MMGSTAFEQRKTLVRLEAMMASHSSSEISSVARITAKPPALLTRTSTRPQRAHVGAVPAQRRGQLLHPSAVEVEGGDLGPFARARLHDGGADALGRTRDDHHFSLELHRAAPFAGRIAYTERRC